MVNPKKQKQVGVILSYTALLLNTLIQLFYTPLMLDKLGKSEYGLYTLALSVTGYLTLLSLGLTGTYNKFFAKVDAEKDEEGLKRLNGMFFVMFAVISATAVLVGIILSMNVSFIFKKNLTPEELQIGKTLVLVLTFNVALSLATTPYTSFINANERFIFYRLIMIGSYVLHGAICVVVLLLGGKSVALTVVSLALTATSITLQFLFCKFKLNYKISVRNISFAELKPIFAFSVFILLYDIINQLNWGIDKVVLGIEVGTAGIAVYGIAAQLNTYYMRISTTIASVFIPQVNRMAVEIKDEKVQNEQLSNLMIKIGRIQFMVVGLVLSGYIFFGQQFIIRWSGYGYRKAYFIGLWLMIPITVDLIQNIGTHISRAKYLHKPITYCFLVVASSNAILSFPLCRMYGAVGCAMATAITTVCGHGLFLNWYYYKKMGLNIPMFWKSVLKILPAFIPPAAVGVVCKLFVTINSYPTIMIYGLGYAAVYFISMYFLGMNSFEKAIIQKFISKFTRSKQNANV
ncbi:MAG: lipopolysaccharide biosynthesis protein [Ruminococcus sp.]|uniref:lipopolysaccharide biosynthesis protein n=1 Tax=Ruminococcus sp. TaxID=41978 RepID=UPI0025DE31A2|nr:lipopolysaccharide biosynthesis protein [Ruminococcus sp.]MCR5601015.1 lipopolysaccharide biosynthesis protein [Ruminococcus sp.]